MVTKAKRDDQADPYRLFYEGEKPAVVTKAQRDVLEQFKRDLEQVCKKHGLRLIGSGDYGILIRTADAQTELASCIWEIGPEGTEEEG